MQQPHVGQTMVHQSFPGPYGPPAYGYHPQPCRWDPNATRDGGAWVCDGYVGQASPPQAEYGLLTAQLARAAHGVVAPPGVAGAPHVGATYESHGTASVPADRPWWWRSYPWWAYSYAQPWYGLQERCYFDPRLGAWVCPASPWAYQPFAQSWFQSPYFMGPISRPVFAIR